MSTLRELEESLKPQAEGRAAALVIRGEDEKKRLSAQIKDVLAATAPKIPQPEPRELGATVSGERIPMDHPLANAKEEEKLWFEACYAIDTKLGIVIDSDSKSECAWIALQRGSSQSPLLLHKLPLINRASMSNPF